MPDKITITLITQKSLHTRETIACILDSFETRKDFVPTHWGAVEPVRTPYKRGDVVSAVSKFDPSECYTPVLCRRKPPTYQACFSTDEGLNSLNVSFPADSKHRPGVDAALVQAIFSLGDTLAARLHPVLGCVHMIWFGKGQDYNASGIIKVAELQEYGPNPVCARTWYGKHILKLIGRDRLTNAGVSFRDTPWGGVQLDLLDDPATGTVEYLKKRQTAVMKQLVLSEVYGNYKKPLKYLRGPKWVPLPGPT